MSPLTALLHSPWVQCVWCRLWEGGGRGGISDSWISTLLPVKRSCLGIGISQQLSGSTSHQAFPAVSLFLSVMLSLRTCPSPAVILQDYAASILCSRDRRDSFRSTTAQKRKLSVIHGTVVTEINEKPILQAGFVLSVETGWSCNYFSFCQLHLREEQN